MSHYTSDAAPNAHPPSYLNMDDGNARPVDSELPVYTPPPSRRPPPTPAASHFSREERLKEFDYDIKRRGRTVVSMTVLADGAYSKHIPTFVEGMPIKGRVYINLPKAEVLQSVVVSIKGEIVMSANPNLNITFIDVSRTLWSQAEGHPSNYNEANEGPVSPVISRRSQARSSSSTSGASSGAIPTIPGMKFNGKLQGEFTWEYSLDIPREVAIPHGNRKEIGMFLPPQTFNERHARASVCYEVIVRFGRGKLQTDYKIPARFGYIPRTQPPPFSPLRRLAYRDGAPLLSPNIDLDGWHPLGPIKLKGYVFNNRPANVKSTLFLAKPLSYTRGTLIAFSLTLESPDQQALDLLSRPQAIIVRLRRRIKYHFDAERSLGTHHLRDTVDDSERVIFWPSTEGSEEPSSRLRFLNGELHLKNDMKPTSAMADFRIEYSVIFFPFEAAGYVSPDDEPLVEQPVEVVTFFAPGPRPRKYLPPGYGTLDHQAEHRYTMPDS